MGFLRKLFTRTDAPPPDRATTAPLTPELLPEEIPGEGRRHLQIGVGHTDVREDNGKRTDAHMIMLGGYDGNDMLPDYGVLALAVGQANRPKSDQAATAAVKAALREVTQGTYMQVLDLEPARDLPSLHTLMGACFSEANRAVRSRVEGGVTSLTLMLVLGGQVVIGHLGNSRAYLWRQQQLKRLTEDHPVSTGEDTEVTPAGSIYAARNREEAEARLLGLAEDPEADITSYELKPGDAIVLASAGLWKALPDDVIAGACQRFADVHRCAEALVTAARDCSGDKEITALVARIPS